MHTEVYNKKNPFRWLYAAAYTPTFWVYDLETNELLEKYYNEFMGINSSSKVKKLSLLKTKNNSSDSLNDTNSTDSEDTYVIGSIDKKADPSKPKIYSIFIENRLYRIDFNKMKQINVWDMTKQRSIKRVSIGNLTDPIQVNTLLKNTFSVKGVAGKKFENNLYS